MKLYADPYWPNKWNVYTENGSIQVTGYLDVDASGRVFFVSDLAEESPQSGTQPAKSVQQVGNGL